MRGAGSSWPSAGPSPTWPAPNRIGRTAPAARGSPCSRRTGRRECSSFCPRSSRRTCTGASGRGPGSSPGAQEEGPARRPSWGSPHRGGSGSSWPTTGTGRAPGDRQRPRRPTRRCGQSSRSRSSRRLGSRTPRSGGCTTWRRRGGRSRAGGTRAGPRGRGMHRSRGPRRPGRAPCVRGPPKSAEHGRERTRNGTGRAWTGRDARRVATPGSGAGSPSRRRCG